jgi:hypothetical protein
MEAYEYIDRENHPGVVQSGMFTRLTPELMSVVKVGDKFIADIQGRFRTCDLTTPIIHTVKAISGDHGWERLHPIGGGSWSHESCLILESLER